MDRSSIIGGVRCRAPTRAEVGSAAQGREGHDETRVPTPAGKQGKTPRAPVSSFLRSSHTSALLPLSARLLPETNDSAHLCWLVRRAPVEWLYSSSWLCLLLPLFYFIFLFFCGFLPLFFVLPAVDMPKDRSCLSASLSTDYWRMCKARHEIADRPSFSLMSFNFSFFLLPLYGPSVYGPHEPKINITYILGVFFGGKLPRPEHERICQAKKLNLSHVFSTQQTWEPSSLPVLRSSTWRAWMNFRPCLDSKS